MRRGVATLILLLLGSATAQDERPVLIKYLSLKQKHSKELQAFQKAYESATTPQAREKALADHRARTEDLAAGFFDLARKAPKQNVAVDALIWVVNHPTGPATGKDLRSQALERLRTQHIRSEKLGQLCTQLIDAPDAASEALLRSALAKSPHAAVQARACMSLAQNLKFRGRKLALFKDDPELIKEYQAAWGKGVVSALRKRNADDLLQESEKLFKRVIKKHGEEPHPLHGTLAKMATTHLSALREPVLVGKPAPEIKGTDHKGKAFTLSEQRGKVVLLSFSSADLPSCKAVYPQQKAAVKKWAGKPFVLLGVSADGSRERLAKERVDGGLTWRFWWDGGGIGGPIATRWEVEMWPTFVLIDHKGTVRDIFIGWPADKALDEALAKLVREAESAGKK